MTDADVPFAMELKNIAGWNQTERDWQGYLKYEPAGCFIAEVEGKAVGTATSIGYGNRFGWIGMVLVHPDARRLGIGTKLLSQAITYLQRRGVAGVKLDATPMGRNVYLPMGFRDEYELTRFQGATPMDSRAAEAGVLPLCESDRDQVVAYDARIFGAERAGVIDSMRQRNPDYCFVARDGGALRGYLIAREGHNAAQIGPWLADDKTTAERLLRAFCARVPGRRVFVDVPHPNPAGSALIQEYGFTVQRGYVRMYLGENRYPGIPGKVFGTSSAEKG
jgi:GNAT superfamily N-acetyltransferase